MIAELLPKYIKTFPEIQEMQQHTTIVIGGMAALELHGLTVRHADDLDLIVYQPSQETIQQILNITGCEGSRGDINGEPRRSFKAFRNGLTVDFLIEDIRESPKKEILLYFNNFPVQSIDIILDAKRQYRREKDANDFNDIISSNFYF